MGFSKGFNVSPVGRAGGLSLWWDDSMEVHVMFSSKNVIDAIVRDCDSNLWVRVTGIYGTAYRGKKAEFWGWMNDHFSSTNTHWLCGGGDFNKFIWDHEKVGRAEVLYNRPRFLEDFMNHTNLLGLDFNGPPFTWRGMRNGSLVEERLDRGLVNNQWLSLWPNSTAIHGVVLGFDHCPIIIKTELEGRRDWGNLLDCVNPGITEDMNLTLMASVSLEEIKIAAFQMGGFKAPGPDGFQGIFY
ncbi:uncharacterized protein [Malus domestica]|uniref:uncharacterized protein n=1 Tax=Malus domestica TaxID=3750 RepID=UPI003976FBCE